MADGLLPYAHNGGDGPSVPQGASKKIAPPFASAGASRAVTFLTRGQLRRWLISPATAAFFGGASC